MGFMKHGKPHPAPAAALAAGVLASGLLLGGCSSGQKPAALSPAAGTGASGAPTGSATGTPTPSASASASTGPGGVALKPAGPTTAALPHGFGTIVAQLPADPNGQAAIDAYIQFMGVATEMEKTATFDQTLADYSDLNALAGVNAAVTALRNKGLHYSGTLAAKPSMTASNPTAKPLPLVTLSVCLDDSKWKTYDKSNHLHTNTLVQGRFLVQVQVHQSADGKWRVTDITGHGVKC
jgi:hypothetical protein